MASFRSLSRNRDFTALWVGATVSELGTRITAFAMPLAAYAISGSALWAAAAEGIFLLGMVAMLLPAGVLADRRHRLRLMRFSLGAGVLLYGSLVVAGVSGALTLPHLLAVALATGVVTGLFSPAEYSAIRSIVSQEELPTALSQQQARQHVAGLLGGPVGGALFSLARWAPFAADAVTYAAGWLLLGRVRADLSPAPAASDAHPVRDLGEGLRFLWDRPFLRVLLVWSPAANLSINALFFLALLRLIEAGFPAWQIGLVETAIGGFGILGALAAPRLIDRYATGPLTIVVAWSFVPLSLPLALWNHPWALALAASVGMFLNPAGNAGVMAYRMAITPTALIGRVQSTMQFTSMLTMPVAPALAGVLLSVFDGGTAVLALTAFVAAVALIPTLSRSVRQVPRPPDWPRIAGPEVDQTPALAST
ncbi:MULTISPECIES: MFS transporter [unclassified Nocardioides]|uniref:MFS transporter n=1 Tax=unclassified Nocardioides TaxID=2615069 RepID=UPI0006F975E8|nr:MULTISPECIES: MFS transporter [unclassified Nocardioides]KRA38620.1 MFS transporter [Nocardioides sp. Root614]KRA92580.1 MFS transporter [Nocardioides sp. Root682]